MVRYIKGEEAEQILTMPKAIELVEQAFRDLAHAHAFDSPRRRIRQPRGHLHIMQAIAPKINVAGFKAGYSRRASIVHLYDYERGKYEAIIEADWMGKMRTAATTAVATRLLARANARVVACFGTGRHGGFQLEAVCAVRTIDEVKVFGRNETRVANFCATMSKKLDVTVRAVKTPREAVAGTDIINVMTPSPTPVFDGAWLEPGQHINATGSNALDRREVDLETVKRSDVIVVDSREVAELECGDLLPAFEAGFVHWKHLPELADIVAGRHPARSSDQQITLFESQGMCIEDLYVGKYVLDTARMRNIGIDLPIDD